ncbi:hypothetical protein [Halobacteriovorax sp.]|uniref:hypothetical protein n=1 Tax=Halobacteriovorax sp. TaxID=2020862 RepID=UPI003562889A
MKQLAMIFSFVLLTFSVNAQTVNLKANCYLSGGKSAVCEVCNDSYSRPIRCAMKIRGITSYGYWFKGSQRGVLRPGSCMSGYVSANNPYTDPLVDAQAYASCRF